MEAFTISEFKQLLQNYLKEGFWVTYVHGNAQKEQIKSWMERLRKEINFKKI
jgi:hypothetical protein